MLAKASLADELKAVNGKNASMQACRCAIIPEL